MDFMRRALELAELAVGSASPNPAVGAVVVRDGRIVGEGFTQPPGQAHAEVVALRQARELAREATLYVTLEPCVHYGRTPPCVSAIIAAGIREVHFSLADPNPLVHRKGRQQLEEAGVNVIEGEGAEASRKINEAYRKFITTGLPFVTAKFAASLDGKIATRTGDSQWITGEAARREAHHIRAIADAIIVGIGTVLADDPQLTARDASDQCLQRQPLRIVVDSHGRTPLEARLLKVPGKALIVTADIADERTKRLQNAGADVASFPADDGAVDLKALLAHLGQRQIASVMVEGGSALLGSLFDQGLVDKVVAFIAPLIIGGKNAKTAVGGMGAEQMAQALRLSDVEIERMGRDIMVVGYPDRN